MKIRNLLVLSVLVAVFTAVDVFAIEITPVTQNQNKEMVAQNKRKMKKSGHRQRKSGHHARRGSGAYQRPYGLAGCGLGSELIKDRTRTSQIFAATLNNTISANQFFGITFGTLNCVDGPKEKVAQRVDSFVSANKVALASDMAKGNGETLSALAGLFQCQDQMLFNQKLHNSFSTIYSNERVPVNDVTDSIMTVILKEQNLKKTCKSPELS